MTTITLPRAVVEQALGALEGAEDHLAKPYSTDARKAITAFRAAMAQQAEQDQAGCETEKDCTSQPWCRISGECHRKQAEPVDTDCHTQGICQRSGYGIGRQSDPQIEDRRINPCPDCRGIGYDASGQLCWCQQNPSF